MKAKNWLKLADISGWILLIILILYFISGYAMVHKYSMEYLMNHSHAWFWHKYLALPFFIFLFLHIFPYYLVKKQLKRLLVILSLVVSLPAISVYAINKTISKENQSEKNIQLQKSIECQNCPNKCLLKPDQVGKCKKFKNIDGKLIKIK